MATPIRERGINWVEAYGDKSTYLKNQMHKQIGPGSYFRWEGHDSTTGNDYYVVVSPGFSKKKGYFFFAGLRKMPADHGASGKKFVTQAEALAHAFDTWGVPRPQEKPAKQYTRIDLVNKPIILEIQHKTADSNYPMTITASSHVPTCECCGKREARVLIQVGSNDRLIQSCEKCGDYICESCVAEKDEDDQPICISCRSKGIGKSSVFAGNIKLGMALGPVMKSCGQGSNWKRLSTQKHYASMLCGALLNSGTMGFLAGFYNQMSLVGIDGYNQSASSPEQYSPVVATCQQPDQNVVNSIKKGTWEKRMLFERKGLKKYVFSEPRSLTESADYKHIHWSELKIQLNWKIPFRFYAKVGPLLDSFVAMGKGIGEDAVSIRPKHKIDQNLPIGPQLADYQRKRSGKAAYSDMLSISVAVAPQLYLKVKNDISNFDMDPANKGKVKNPPVLDKRTQSFGLILEQLAEEKGMKEGMPADPNQIIGESSNMSGSQLFYYDEHGLPFMLRGAKNELSLVPRSIEGVEDEPSQSNTFGGQLRNSLNGGKMLIADNMVEGMDLIGKEYESILQEEALFIQLRKTQPNHPEIAAKAASISRRMQSLVSIAKNLKTMRGRNEKAKAKFIESCNRYIDQRVKTSEECYKFLSEGKDPKNVNRDGLMQAQKAIQYQLLGFRAMADLGMVDIDANRFVYAQTCANVRGDVYTKAYDTNSYGLPKNTKDLRSISGPKNIVPPTPIGAVRSGNQLVARRLVLGQSEWPEEEEEGEETGRPKNPWAEEMVVVDPNMANQIATGAHYYVEGEQRKLSTSDAGGAPSFSRKYRLPRMDPNSKGRYISGEAKAILARPVGFSPKKSGAGLEVPHGWELQEEHYRSFESDGLPSVQKAERPESLDLPQANLENDFWMVTNEEGERISVADTIRKDEDKKIWKDFGKLAMFMQEKFCLPDDIVGAFTQCTNTDLFLSKDYQETAKHYYAVLKKHDDVRRNKVFRDSVELGRRVISGQAATGIPKEITDRATQDYLLEQEAMSLRTDPEAMNLRRFGEVCQFCSKTEEGGMGDTIREDVVRMLERAMENPRNSLRPKAGPMYGIKMVKDGKEQWATNPDEQDPLLFSSRQSPWIKTYLKYFQSAHPDLTPKIELYSSRDVLVPSVKRTKQLVKKRGSLETLMYAQKGQQPPSEDWGDDVTYALGADKTGKEEPFGEEKPQEPTPEETKPEEKPLGPEPAVPTPPAPTAVPSGSQKLFGKDAAVNMLRMMLRPVFDKLKGVDLNALHAAPPDVVNNAKMTLDRALGLIKVNSKVSPYLDEALMEIGLDKLRDYSPPLPPPTAKVVEKLVKLANKLDEQGRTKEAEDVDRVIEATIRKATT